MNKQEYGESPGAGALWAQDAAFELFHVAALILGNQEQAVSLVEEILAKVDADPCANTGIVQEKAQPRLVEEALLRLTKLHPQAFVAQSVPANAEPCIDTDDLSATGLTNEQLASLIKGPDRPKTREWLEQLPPALRVVFILRAVVGQDGEKTAETLRGSGASGASSWTREHVGIAYRQALCSLASSLVSSTSTSVVPV